MPQDADRSRGRQTARERTAARRAAEQEAERRRRQRARTWGGIAVAVLVVAAVAVTVAIQSARTDTSGAATPANTASGTDGTAFAVAPADTDAPVTVDVYEDYLCPACRAFGAEAAATLDGFAADGDVEVRYRPVAILDRLSDDRYSTRAANAAAVVADAAGVEAFARFSELLFARQPAEGGPGLTDEQLVDLAGQVGADGDDVAAGIRDLRFGDWVGRATDRASQDGLPGTPWVLVDGTPLERPTASALAAAVDAARP